MSPTFEGRQYLVAGVAKRWGNDSGGFEHVLRVFPNDQIKRTNQNLEPGLESLVELQCIFRHNTSANVRQNE